MVGELGTYAYYGTLRYFANTGSSSNPAFVEQVGTANPFEGTDLGYDSSPNLVDLDGDGDLDAVLGDYLGNVRAFENTGSSSVPGFVERTGTANPFDGIGIGARSSPDLVDLDGDGDFDVLVGEASGRMVFLRSLNERIFSDGFESGDTSTWSNIVR